MAQKINRPPPNPLEGLRPDTRCLLLGSGGFVPDDDSRNVIMDHEVEVKLDDLEATMEDPKKKSPKKKGPVGGESLADQLGTEKKVEEKKVKPLARFDPYKAHQEAQQAESNLRVMRQALEGRGIHRDQIHSFDFSLSNQFHPYVIIRKFLMGLNEGEGLIYFCGHATDFGEWYFSWWDDKAGIRCRTAINATDLEGPAGRVLVLMETGYPVLPKDPWARPNLDFFLVGAAVSEPEGRAVGFEDGGAWTKWLAGLGAYPVRQKALVRPVPDAAGFFRLPDARCAEGDFGAMRRLLWQLSTLCKGRASASYEALAYGGVVRILGLMPPEVTELRDLWSLCCDVIGHMASTVPMQNELGKLGACTHVLACLDDPASLKPAAEACRRLAFNHVDNKGRLLALDAGPRLLAASKDTDATPLMAVATASGGLPAARIANGKLGLARCANVLRSPAGREGWELEAALTCAATLCEGADDLRRHAVDGVGLAELAAAQLRAESPHVVREAARALAFLSGPRSTPWNAADTANALCAVVDAPGARHLVLIALAQIFQVDVDLLPRVPHAPALALKALDINVSVDQTYKEDVEAALNLITVLIPPLRRAGAAKQIGDAAIRTMRALPGELEVCARACRIIGELASDKEVRAYLGSIGAVEAVTSAVLTAPRQEYRCIAALSVLSADATNGRKAVGFGVIPHIEKVAKNAPAKAAHWAATCLVNLLGPPPDEKERKRREEARRTARSVVFQGFELPA